ncbi:hypothetical protein JHK87_053019 [Glycine soja]|nr:hypothetical protein JHK87_053019 [Glycine soja]
MTIEAKNLDTTQKNQIVHVVCHLGGHKGFRCSCACTCTGTSLLCVLIESFVTTVLACEEPCPLCAFVMPRS